MFTVFVTMFQSLVFVNVSVVVLCASPDSVREIMIKAHELNFDNGEYVFFNIDLFSRLELCLFAKLCKALAFFCHPPDANICFRTHNHCLGARNKVSA